MKNRSDQARYESYRIKSSLDIIDKLINHMDNYELLETLLKGLNKCPNH